MHEVRQDDIEPSFVCLILIYSSLLRHCGKVRCSPGISHALTLLIFPILTSSGLVGFDLESLGRKRGRLRIVPSVHRKRNFATMSIHHFWNQLIV